MGSVLGTMLHMLSSEMGHINRTPTSPHNSTQIPLGARSTTRRTTATARTIQLADRLICTTFSHTSLI